MMRSSPDHRSRSSHTTAVTKKEADWLRRNVPGDVLMGHDPSTGDINTINSVDNAKISTTVGTAVFDPSTHRVKISGYQTTGDLLVIQEHGGNPIVAGKSDMTGRYGASPDFFTFAGNKYRAFYSPSTGTATSIVFDGVDPSNTACAVTGTGTLATPSP
jgi:hypothetical protein